MTRIPDGAASMETLVQGAERLPQQFEACGQNIQPHEVDGALEPFLSPERMDRIETVIASRCARVAVVTEGLANSGNVAAVMRTAEGLGYLRFDVITGDIPYKHSARTTQGTEKWLDVRIWKTPRECCRDLKQSGYRVLATHLDEKARPLGDFDFSIPTALVFGNELGGVSPALLEEADGTCIIPMSGFAQSFNISVAAATCLYHVREDRIRRLGSHGDLSDQEIARLRAAYRMRSVAHAQAILDRAFGC